MVEDNHTPDPGATHTAEHRVLPAGTVLAGRYELLELLGMGGMGMVYRARDQRLNLDVALKVLNPERAGDQQTLERFERELVLARQVSHPNVVRIHDIGQHHEVHFLTMDFVPGRSLKEILQANGHLPREQALSIASDLARALQVAHEHSVVHRDLKPANVLVDEQGHAHITDFGVARSMTTPGLTRTGHILGTPHYLSPEQALGGTLDGRSDLYALGLLLFEMLTGELPFAGDSYDEALAQRIAGRPNLQALDDDTPDWLRAVIARCLAREPGDRYPDAGALLQDLEQGSATHAPRRLGQAPLYAGLFALALGLLFAGGWWLQRDANQPATPAGDQAKSAQATALHTVVVVPFADQTGRSRLAWISTGAAEMLALQLAESPALQVVDTLRVFRTVDDLNLGTGFLAEAERGQLSELLDADRLVMGRIRSLGTALSIEARLTEAGAQTGVVQDFKVSAAGPDQLLSAIGGLAGQLRQALQARAGTTHEQILSASPEAMAAYSKGVAQLAQGNALAAVQSLQRALAVDPVFAAAWVRLADAYQSLGFGDQARQAAAQAVAELDQPGGRVALQAQALSAALEGDMEQALEHRRELVTRYPNDIQARVALGELLGNAGRLDEARRVLEAVVAQDPNNPRAWYLLGKFAILAGDSRHAIDEYLVRALVIQNKLNNPQGKADVLNAMGIAYAQLGETKQAQSHYEQAMELRREIGDQRGVAAALSNLAHLHLLQGEYEAARLRLNEALEIQSGIGDRGGVAYIHNELGVLEEEQGHYSQALQHYRDALKIRQELGNQRALAESYNNVGYVYYLLGEYDNAAVYAGQALSLYQSTNHQEGAMQARHTLALVETARGNWDEALKAALAALDTSRELKYPIASAVSLGILGKVAFYQGRYDAALDSYEEALAIVEEIGDPRGLTEFTLNLANVYLVLGATQDAAKALEQAEVYLNQGGNREQRADLLRLKGELALVQNNAAGAIELLQQAMTTAEASGSVISMLEVQLALARTRLAQGDPAAALDLLQPAVKNATDIGHAVLSLQTLQALARTQIHADRLSDAANTLDQALSSAQSHAPYAQEWRLHWLHAELLEAQKGTGTDASYEAAYQALARVREHIPEVHRAAFDNQPIVKQLDARFPEVTAK